MGLELGTYSLLHMKDPQVRTKSKWEADVPCESKHLFGFTIQHIENN